MPAFRRSSSSYLLVAVAADGQLLQAMTLDLELLKELLAKLRELGVEVEELGASLCG